MNIKRLLILFKTLNSKTFEKGEIVINEGDIINNVYYIRKGLVRSYLINNKCEEITFQLFTEKQLFGNVHTILFNEPSKFTFETLEKTKVYFTDLKTFHDLSNANSDLLINDNGNFGRQILKQAFQRIDSFVFLSPEKRYQQYLKDYPNIINRVPDKYIANVLGITPVSLSRIRQRISKKK
jgi:CRP-like cAMP-binding protein